MTEIVREVMRERRRTAVHVGPALAALTATASAAIVVGIMVALHGGGWRNITASEAVSLRAYRAPMPGDCRPP